MESIRYSNTCLVKQEKTGKTVEAVVHDFKQEDRLIVILNKSVKLNLTWNGKLYEGVMAGMDFVSDGPKITKYSTGIRG